MWGDRNRLHASYLGSFSSLSQLLCRFMGLYIVFFFPAYKKGHFYVILHDGYFYVRGEKVLFVHVEVIIQKKVCIWNFILVYTLLMLLLKASFHI